MHEVLANILHSRSRGYNLFLHHTGKCWRPVILQVPAFTLPVSLRSEHWPGNFDYSFILLSWISPYAYRLQIVIMQTCGDSKKCRVHNTYIVAVNTLIFPNLQFLLINTLLAIILIKRRVAARSAEPFVRVSCFSVMNWNRVPLKNLRRKHCEKMLSYTCMHSQLLENTIEQVSDCL